MEGLVVIYRASGMAEAELVKGYLESEGLPVDLDYESAGQVYGFTMDGLGEVRLRVPLELEREARAALARRPGVLEIQPRSFEEMEDDEPPEEDDLEGGT
jgi:hypothetical protein